MDHVLDLVATAQGHALGSKRTCRGVAVPAIAVFDIAAADRFGMGHIAVFVFVAVVSLYIGIGPIIVTAIILVMPVNRFVIALGLAQPLFLFGMLRFFAQQGIAIFFRDLIVIRVDFRKGEKAVTVSAIIDEGRLQRRLHARHLGKIDISLELLVLGRFEIKFLDPVSLGDGHAGFFPVAGVDQHPRCHV